MVDPRARGRRAIHVRRRCFVVNVAARTIAIDPHAGAAPIEAVITVYLIVYAFARRRAGTRLDIPGAAVLFTGLPYLVGPRLFGHDAPHFCRGCGARNLTLVNDDDHKVGD